MTADPVALDAERRRMRLIADASAHLSRSLDLAATLAAVARVTVPDFADWCFVELKTADGGIERVMIEHRDPRKRGFIDEYDRRYPLDPAAPVGSAAVIRTGEPELIPEMSDEMLAAVAADEEQLRLLRGAGFRSSIIVPLRVRGEVIGDLALASAESGRRYDERDLAAMQELADRCAMAIDNARLHGELLAAEAEARRARDEAEAILGSVPDAVTVQAADGRVVYANRAALERLDYPTVEALAAAPVEELRARYRFDDEYGRPLAVERLPGRRALSGECPEPLLVRHRSPQHDGELRWARVQATGVPGPDGAPRLAVNVIEDVTDIKRAELGERFLADSSRVLAGSLDYDATLRAVAHLAVPGFADWCAVDLVERDRLRRVAVAHSDPAGLALAEELRRRYPTHGGGILAEVVATGSPRVIADIDEAMLADAAVDAEHLRMLRALGLRSGVVVPMTLRGHVLGTLTFVTGPAGRRFDLQDVGLACDLGLRAAVAIDNARLYESSVVIARTLQSSLLPPHLPTVPGAEVAAVYRPAGHGLEVGGDFYDVFNLADEDWFLVVGDVCGKGAEAAAVTALARYTIRAAAARRRSPSAILRRLNDAMLSQADAAGRFCTIACAHLDLARAPARLTVASGGHPLPLLLRAGGEVEEVGAPGTLLGMLDDVEVDDHPAELRAGDAFVAYTDGLTEANAPARVWSSGDVGRVLGALAGQRASALVDGLADAALDGVAAPRDDIAVLALRMLGTP